MSNLNQIKARIQAYSPMITFIPMNLISVVQLTGFSKTVLCFTDEGMSPTRTQFRKTTQTFHKVRASGIQYYSGNKPVVYALLHGHASYPKPGCVLLGFVEVDIGVRDDTANRG
ncbi:hypothetical protein L2E82_51424 [Cichorium intybus]|nr:hypothetical protein L2E82_51424 [Cichorium intybus]